MDRLLILRLLPSQPPHPKPKVWVGEIKIVDKVAQVEARREVKVTAEDKEVDKVAVEVRVTATNHLLIPHLQLCRPLRRLSRLRLHLRLHRHPNLRQRLQGRVPVEAREEVKVTAEGKEVDKVAEGVKVTAINRLLIQRLRLSHPRPRLCRLYLRPSHPRPRLCRLYLRPSHLRPRLCRLYLRLSHPRPRLCHLYLRLFRLRPRHQARAVEEDKVVEVVREGAGVARRVTSSVAAHST